MTRTHGPPSTTNRLCHTTLLHFGQGKTAAGRYTFATPIGNAGAGPTTVVGGPRALMASGG